MENPKQEPIKQKFFRIKEADRNALMQFLGEFPFKNVVGAIQLLQNLEEIQDKKE